MNLPRSFYSIEFIFEKENSKSSDWPRWFFCKSFCSFWASGQCLCWKRTFGCICSLLYVFLLHGRRCRHRTRRWAASAARTHSARWPGDESTSTDSWIYICVELLSVTPWYSKCFFLLLHNFPPTPSQTLLHKIGQTSQSSALLKKGLESRWGFPG